MQPTHERWLPVVGHVGYEVSNIGRVRSYRGSGKSPDLARVPRLLSPALMKAGYRQVTLAEPRAHRYVHHLVAEAFIGPRPFGTHIAHNNGIPDDNRVENLRYDTPRGNSLDRWLHGTGLRGEQVKVHKLTDEEVVQIRHLFADGATQRDLAIRFNVVQQTISKVTRGEHWTHLAGPTYRRETTGTYNRRQEAA